MINMPLYILYAEDDEDDRFLFLEAIGAINVNIDIVNASNGKEVVDYLLNIAPDQHLPAAIISDLRMPLCNGLELLAKIKQEYRWKHIPFILFSTSSNFIEMALAKNLGVEAFFTKPSTSWEVMSMAKEIIAICNGHHSSL